MKRQDPADFLKKAGRPGNGRLALVTGLVVVALGVINMCIHARLKQAHGGWMRDAGVNPGGAYLALGGMPKRMALLLGLGFIASGALLEEILFRGFLLQWARGASGPANGVIAQGVLFGLIHGVPMACARAPDESLPTLLMPIASGIALGWLAVTSGGLAYPWLAHWALNYLAFAVEVMRPKGTARCRTGPLLLYYVACPDSPFYSCCMRVWEMQCAQRMRWFYEAGDLPERSVWEEEGAVV